MLQTPIDWAAYRGEFPVAENIVYFNHASTGPLPRRTAQAMQQMLEGQLLRGGLDWRDWNAALYGARRAAARLIHADPVEIALTKNTSEGLSFVANGLDWRPGDVVVGVRDEFPANYFPWKRLVERGVEVRWLDLIDGRLDLDRIDEACQGARLFAVSFVQYLSGFRLDLQAAGEICRRRGCLFVVDAVQGLGPFPVDVRAAGIHALSASAHKWLLGPEGVALLYLERELAERLDVVEFGWTNVTGFPRYSKHEELRPGAGRFECGTMNTVGAYGLRSSIELFLELGVRSVADRVNRLASRIAEGAVERGFSLAAARGDGDGSGIVSIRKDGWDAAEAAAKMLENGISVSPRHGYLRAAPHFYNTEEEVARYLELLR